MTVGLNHGAKGGGDKEGSCYSKSKGNVKGVQRLDRLAKIASVAACSGASLRPNVVSRHRERRRRRRRRCDADSHGAFDLGSDTK